MRCLLLIAAVLLLSVQSCSGRSSNPAPGEASSAALERELARLSELPAPRGVDDSVWESLRQELRRLLVERGGRSVSSPPDSDSSRAPLSFDADTATLSWGHYNTGDYDQNGEVNIADLTPVGINFGAAGPFQPDSALAVVDGDANGEINISDVTPIGQNFGRLVQSYNVYSSSSPGEYPASNTSASSIPPLASLQLSEAPLVAGQRRRFSYIVAEPQPAAQYWVRPSDGSAEGSPSSPAGPGAPVPFSVELYQISFDYGDGIVHENSAWGMADVTFMGQEGPLYFNFSFNGVTVFSNLPLLSDRGPGLEHTISLPFSLGTAEGTPVAGGEAQYSLSAVPGEILEDGASDAENDQPVLQRTTGLTMDGENPPAPGPAENNFGLLPSGVSTFTTLALRGEDFPNQDCGPRESTAAAVSNSLLYLEQKHDLPMGIGTGRPTDIGAMRLALGDLIVADKFFGAPEEWPENKATFMRALAYPVETRVTKSVQKAAEALQDGCDVEVEVLRGSGEFEGREVHAVSSILSDDQGNTFVQYLLDGQPGVPGGLERRMLVISPVDDFSSKPRGLGGQAEAARFIIECPAHEEHWHNETVVEFSSYPSALLFPDGDIGLSSYFNANDFQQIRFSRLRAPFFLADTEVNVDPQATDRNFGPDNSVAIVDGRPAIAYQESFPSSSLWYVAASDEKGTQWGQPVELDSDALQETGRGVSLELVEDAAWLSYFKGTTLRSVRAANAQGTLWDQPIDLQFTSTFSSGEHTDILQTSAGAALAFNDNQVVKLLTGINPDSGEFDEQVITVTVDTDQWDSAVIADRIGIAYRQPLSGISYLISETPAGQSFSTPIELDGISIGNFVSLAEVQGRAACAWLDNSAFSIIYRQADDAEGSLWSEPLEVVGNYSIGMNQGNIKLMHNTVSDHVLIFTLGTAGVHTELWGLFVPQI